jgi:hypothetical protein
MTEVIFSLVSRCIGWVFPTFWNRHALIVDDFLDGIILLGRTQLRHFVVHDSLPGPNTPHDGQWCLNEGIEFRNFFTDFSDLMSVFKTGYWIGLKLQGYDHVQAYLGICQKKLYVKKIYVKKLYVKKSRSCEIFCISLLLITVACTIYIDSSILAQIL